MTYTKLILSKKNGEPDFRTPKFVVLVVLNIIGVFWAYSFKTPIMLLLPVCAIFYIYKDLNWKELAIAILFGLVLGIIPLVVKWIVAVV